MSLRRSVSTVYVHCICSVYSVSYSVSYISINLQCQVYLLFVSVMYICYSSMSAYIQCIQMTPFTLLMPGAIVVWGGFD